MFIRLHPRQVTVNCVLEADTVADKPPVSSANGIKVACKVYLKINLKQNLDSSAFAGLTRLLIPARAHAPAQVGGLGAQGDGTSESSGAGGAGPEAGVLDAGTHHHRGNYPTLPSTQFLPRRLVHIRDHIFAQACTAVERDPDRHNQGSNSLASLTSHELLAPGSRILDLLIKNVSKHDPLSKSEVMELLEVS